MGSKRASEWRLEDLVATRRKTVMGRVWRERFPQSRWWLMSGLGVQETTNHGLTPLLLGETEKPQEKPGFKRSMKQQGEAEAAGLPSSGRAAHTPAVL